MDAKQHFIKLFMEIVKVHNYIKKEALDCLNCFLVPNDAGIAIARCKKKTENYFIHIHRSIMAAYQFAQSGSQSL